MVLDVLGDPTRRQILERLVDGPLAVGVIAEGMPVSRPAVSQHLRTLVDAGMVDAHRDGTRRLYRLRPEGIAPLRAWLDTHWRTAMQRYTDTAQQQARDNTADDDLRPVEVTVHVPLGPAAAFRLFTEDMTTWWPLHSHSVGESRSRAVAVGAAVGEPIVETHDDGEAVWGTLTVWSPPHAVGFTWHPGRGAEGATDVLVRFVGAASGGTVVTLTHSGWAVLGERAAPARASYDTGWVGVLVDGYVAAAHAVEADGTGAA